MPGANGLGPDRTPPGVEAHEVSTVLAGVPVLHRLDLHVPAGAVTVLMGPSGVGKTTLVKHVVGLSEPDLGTVLVGDRDVWAVRPRERAAIQRGISPMLGGGSLFDTSLFGSLSVLENVTYALRLAGVPERERHETALARLTELDLEEHLSDLPATLPAHARRRLALARTLAVDAPLTVLDEIDVGLDADHHAAVVAAVLGSRARTSGTLLITTHTLELARALADEVAILVNGRIVVSGSREAVLDGVTDATAFLWDIEMRDHAGPGHLAGARLAVPREATRKPEDTVINPWLVVLGLILVVVLIAAAVGALS
jgi:phospholipid/cholesterol/gamma-HCH transport system ATP-binding protein